MPPASGVHACSCTHACVRTRAPLHAATSMCMHAHTHTRMFAAAHAAACEQLFPCIRAVATHPAWLAVFKVHWREQTEGGCK